MGKWSTVLKWVAKPFKSVGKAAAHPQQTLVGAGNAVKTATVGAGVGYVGWEALVKDKPVLQTVGDVVLGEETNAAVKDTVHSTAGAIGGTIGAAKDAITGVTDAVGSVNNAASSWGGIGSFMGNVTGGNGKNMFDNLFNNIFSGKVSMMSMLGLVASALLVFGRFGWLGKIAGALLGMLLIGNNSKIVHQQAERNEDNQQDKSAEKTEQKHEVEQQPRPTIRR